MIRKGPRGVITVFAALSFMLIAQLLLVLAEGCRQMEMVKVAEMNTDSVLESTLAAYCRPLWEDDHLLAYDAGGEGSSVDTEGMSEYLMNLTASDFAVDSESVLGGTNLLRMSASEVTFPQYTLLTDDSGKVYAKTVSSYMQQNFTYEAAKKAYGNYESVKSLQKNNQYDSGAVGKANSSLKKAAESGSSSATPSPAVSVDCKKTAVLSVNSVDKKKTEVDTRVNPTPVSTTESDSGTAENLLQEVAKKQAAGILTLVVPEGKTVSSSKITLSETVSHRTLAKGVNPEQFDLSWYDEVMLQQYLVTYLSDYSHPKEDAALSYELEYLLGGKASDEANLKAAVTELMAVREAANAAYICSDSTMKSEVTAMATAIGGATLTPPLIKAVETGLIAAWAFAESVLDVRALLSGRKIALMKSKKTWTSSLKNIPSLLDGNAMAVDCSGGLSYSSYLGILLFTERSEKLAMRAMDVQEAAIQKMENYSDFQMDHCICSLETEISYVYSPIFYSFVKLITITQNEYAIVKKSKMSYLSNSG